jgi:extracellular factor (EF) 3-hydroxypalmitic acid methyl ester biosynthesis protein
VERVELKTHAFANPLRTQLEKEAVEELAKPVIEAIDLFISQFESIVGKLEPDAHPGHYAYFRRQLHSLVLVSPFAHRAFSKPLGYAGDYEMVNMMIRSPYEGDTLFAKIINIWLLKQSPAQAHRNRVAHLTTKLIEETVRVRSEGRVATIFNLGCGPAQEVQRFLEDQHIYECADFTLVDFNEETLAQLNKYLTDISRRLPRPATFRMIKKSVFHILKSGDKSLLHPSGEKYDYVYCAGLFDYLSDDVCKQMMDIFYGMLAPGGLLLATNATEVLNSSRPFRFSMEYILDWHLVYRDQQQFFNLKPDLADDDDVKVIAENTGTNLFLEVRKPKNV